MTKKRKNIAALFGDANAVSANQQEPAAAPVKAEASSSVQKNIGRSLDAMLDQLSQKSLDVLELDPSLVDPSPYSDRLPDDDDTAFEIFKRSIETEGQKVPIQVRSHPGDPDRYQVIYGHRRIRALKELNRTVKAQCIECSDEELVIAQGIENGQRQDLTWIEKALFADLMQRQGITSKDCQAALTVDRAELSKYRSVVETLTRELIEQIGRAPSIGRPRWIELAELSKGKGARTRIAKLLAAANMEGRSSSDRFLMAYQALTAANKKHYAGMKTAEPLGEIGQVTYAGNQVRIKLDDQYAEPFNHFLKTEMPELLERFLKTQG